MRVEPLAADAAPSSSATADGSAFGRILDALAGVLGDAKGAEDAFAGGHGRLEDAVYERARADVALSVAVATAQRVAQSVQSILNLQV